MSNLRPQVRSSLRSFLQSQDGYHNASDVLRVIEEEASLMKETTEICELLDRDPFEQLGDVKKQVQRLKSILTVSSCSRVRTREYIGIDAVVTINNGENLELTFKYEHKPRQNTKGSHVWYSIEMAQNHSQRENLLVVQVWAPKDAPCTTAPAVCIDLQDEESLWEDIDENNESFEQEKAVNTISDESESVESSQKVSKKQKVSYTPENFQSGESSARIGDDENSKDEEEEEKNDSYMAWMDPDLLNVFLESAGIGPMDEGTAFFLLMTFPFYEHEWDLVGFVLKEMFGSESDVEEDGMSDA